MHKRIFFLSLLASVAAAAPVVTIETDYSGTYVYQGSSVICELKDNRFLRFRSNAADSLWIGQEKKPADIGWGYQDIKGYEHVSLEKKIAPGRFGLHLTGRKEIADGNQETVITGVWDEETQNFNYTIKSHIEADLEKWYQHSRWAKNSYKTKPDAWVQLEPMDFHIERISIPDRFFIGDHNKEIYDCFVFSDDGREWMRFPKVSAISSMYKADWKYKFNRSQGSYFGFVDRNEGGWLTRLNHSSAPERVEICWYWFDIHQVINEGLPPRHSAERFEAEQEWEFIRLTPGRTRDILKVAEEFPWRDMPEYRRPVFTRNNDFRQLIDGEKFQWSWRSSSPYCLWDDTVGYDDHQSVSIIKTSDERRIDSWYAQIQWDGYYMTSPFEWERLPPNRKVRISARVKTSGVSGRVRLRAIYAGYAAVLYTNKEGIAATDAEIESSESLTGDTDWTELEVYFTSRDPWNFVSLEIEGTGKVWFDNVVIEEVK